MSAFVPEDMLAFKKADARQMHSQIVNTHKMQIIGELDEANPTRAKFWSNTPTRTGASI